MYGCEPNETVEVDSFEKASLLCQQFIARNELGGGNWAGGLITDGRKPIAYVSYNGRVWKITKDAPVHSGKNEEIKLNPEKLESYKVIFTHVSTTTPYGDNCSRFEYVDQYGRKFVFRDTNTPWEYKLLLPTHEDFHNRRAIETIIGQRSFQAIGKVDHEGKRVPDGTPDERYDNAVKKLVVVL
jgi:hypothetical protein